jgi:type IV pilus assembly protein PilA
MPCRNVQGAAKKARQMSQSARTVTAACPRRRRESQTPPPTSGKAIASLVLGIFPVIPFVGSIVAIVLGAVSRSEIRRSGGRLKGDGLALAGLILGCLQVAVIPIVLIVAAIAIPNLLRARIAANQAAAVGSLRAIDTAEVMYATTYGGYSPDLAALGPPPSGPPSAETANLIDSVLSKGTKLGYVFAYEAGERDPNGRITTYQVHADPVTSGTTGMSHYFTDQTGAIRQERDRQADSTSPPLAALPQHDGQRGDLVTDTPESGCKKPFKPKYATAHPLERAALPYHALDRPLEIAGLTNLRPARGAKKKRR